MDLSAFVRNLDEEELRALVNHSPGAGVKESPLAGKEAYRELVLLCADELARRWRIGRQRRQIRR